MLYLSHSKSRKESYCLMAKSQDTAAFESLVNQKNKDMFNKARGAKNQFKEFEGPDGKYYGRIQHMKLDTFEMERYDNDGKKTGMKEKVPRVTINAVTVCIDDNTVAPSELEKWKGEPANIMYLLQKQEDWERLFADIYTMTGVDTNKMKLLAQEVKADDEFTIADVMDAINEGKPYCRFSVTTSAKNQRKYANYRGAVVKEDLESILQHSLDGDDVETEQYQQTESQEGMEVPFDSGSGEGTEEQVGGEEEGDPNVEWDEEKQMWHKLDDDTWYDVDGNPVEVEKPKPVPPKRAMPPSFKKQVEAAPKAETAPKPAVRRPGQIAPRK